MSESDSESQNNCCKECGKPTTSKCNVCNETYTESSQVHNATESHKKFKALVKSLKELNHDDKNSLFERYVEGVTSTKLPAIAEDKPKKAKKAEPKPAKKSSKKLSHFSEL